MSMSKEIKILSVRTGHGFAVLDLASTGLTTVRDVFNYAVLPVLIPWLLAPVLACGGRTGFSISVLTCSR